MSEAWPTSAEIYNLFQTRPDPDAILWANAPPDYLRDALGGGRSSSNTLTTMNFSPAPLNNRRFPCLRVAMPDAAAHARELSSGQLGPAQEGSTLVSNDHTSFRLVVVTTLK